MAGIEVVRVLVGLEAIADRRQRDAVHQRGGHQVGTEVDQEVVVDQHSGAAAQAAATDLAGTPTVVTVAESVRIPFGGGGAEES